MAKKQKKSKASEDPKKAKRPPRRARRKGDEAKAGQEDGEERG